MEILLKSKGLIVFVDDEDFHLCRNLQRGRDGLIYTRHRQNKKEIRRGIHRIIMNAPKGLTVDHINGNTLDNRKCNLRLATPSQNSCNRGRPNVPLLHKYRGIAFFKKKLVRPWNARIKVNNKPIYGGYFNTPEEAALAYDELAKKHHGEFARLNFP